MSSPAYAMTPEQLSKAEKKMQREITKTYERQTDKAGGSWYSYVTVYNEDGTLTPILDDKADTKVSAYSVNKVAVALAVMDKVDRGLLHLDQKLELRPEDIVPGSGIYHLQTVYGDNVTIANLVTSMLLVSDNSAVRVLSRVVPGEEINQILAEKGFTVTRVEPVAEPPGRFFLGQTTPREMSRLLQGIADKTLLSSESGSFLLNIMSWVNGYHDGVRRNMSSLERTNVVTKYGAFEDSRHEVGIIYDGNGPALIYTFFNTGMDDVGNYGATHPAVEAQAVLGRVMYDAVWDAFYKKSPAAEPSS